LSVNLPTPELFFYAIANSNLKSKPIPNLNPTPKPKPSGLRVNTELTDKN